MFKQIWKLFIEHIWPLLWPIVRDTVIEVIRDLMAWIKRAISDMMQKNAKQQQDDAEAEAKTASKRAANAGNQEDKIRAEAEAATWQKVAEKLKADNECLKTELTRVMQEAEKYAEERIQSESVMKSAESRVLSLPPPNQG